MSAFDIIFIAYNGKGLSAFDIVFVTSDINNSLSCHRNYHINKPWDHVFGIFPRRDRLIIGMRMVETDDFKPASLDFPLHLIKKERVRLEMRPSPLSLNPVRQSTYFRHLELAIRGVFPEQNPATFVRITLPGLFCNTLPPAHFLTLDTRFQDFLRKHVATDAVDGVLEAFTGLRVLGKERDGGVADVQRNCTAIRRR